MESPPTGGGASTPQQPFGRTNGAGGLASVHRSALPRTHARFFGIRRHCAGPDPLTDELDHVEKPALGQWSCRSLLGLPSSPQHVSGRVARAEPVGLSASRFDCARKVYKLNSLQPQARSIRMKSTSKKRNPSIVSLTVKRRYLTQREIDRLMDCARKHGRYGHRDATMILVAYRHGLRASEICDLQWQQIELSEGRLHVHRVKNGIPSVHPIRGDEMRALRKLRRDYPKEAYVFVSERGGPISPIGFHRLIQRVGEAAKMPFPIHPHM